MRKVFYQKGASSKFHAYLDPSKPGQQWTQPAGVPYMFGRGWRKFRKHRFETNQGSAV